MSIAQTAIPSLDRVYAEHVNPQWVRLLSARDGRRYVRALGAELRPAGGTSILDFLSGYGVYNVGHHHPRIVEALKDELRAATAMLQSEVPELATLLAERLSRLAGGGLEKVYFTNTGSEGVETVIKFARAHTKRDAILYAARRISRPDVRRPVLDEQPVVARRLRTSPAGNARCALRRPRRTRGELARGALQHSSPSRSRPNRACTCRRPAT